VVAAISSRIAHRLDRDAALGAISAR